MILHQTLSTREKIIGVVAVLFLLALVAFGYNQTVVQPAQASVLHTEKLQEDYTHRYEELTAHFDEVRENLALVKSTSVKSKIRSIKECLLQARKGATAQAAFASCEKLFVDVETEVDAFTDGLEKLGTAVGELEHTAGEYEAVVNEALHELEKKNKATLGTGGH